MKKTDVYKLADMIEEIKTLDELIRLHSAANPDSIMVSQYQAKKVKLLSSVIDELASPGMRTTRSLLLIRTILDKFFPKLQYSIRSEDDTSFGFQVLEKALV